MELILKNTNIEEKLPLLFGLKNLSLNSNTISLEKLKTLKNKNIYLSIDKNIFNEDLKYLEKALKTIDKIEIKGIFFYDLAVLSLSKKLNLKTKLIWNQDFLVTNYKTCNYYKHEKVKGAVLSPLTIQEITKIRENTSLELFVNIFGYQVMAISRRKLLTSYYDYLNEKNNKNINYITEKTGTYPVIETPLGTKFLTKNVLNGIRYINKLKEIGINYLILDGILLDNDTFLKVLEYYKEAVYNNVKEQRLLEMEKKITELLKTDLGFFEKDTIYKVKKND